MRAIVVLFVLSMANGYAGTVVSATTSVVPPLTSYSYTVFNAGPETVFEFTLFLQGPILIDTATIPAGWSASISPTFVDWFAIDQIRQIAPGTSLGGFSFSSLQQPDSATFVTIGIDDLANVIVTSDNTIGPAAAAVPEPSTLALMSVAAVILLGCQQVGSKRHQGITYQQAPGAHLDRQE